MKRTKNLGKGFNCFSLAWTWRRQKVVAVRGNKWTQVKVTRPGNVKKNNLPSTSTTYLWVVVRVRIEKSLLHSSFFLSVLRERLRFSLSYLSIYAPDISICFVFSKVVFLFTQHQLCMWFFCNQLNPCAHATLDHPGWG